MPTYEYQRDASGYSFEHFQGAPEVLRQCDGTPDDTPMSL
jgi:predicted nucleic acid-binding Zn ribbon protein